MIARNQKKKDQSYDNIDLTNRLGQEVSTVSTEIQFQQNNNNFGYLTWSNYLSIHLFLGLFILSMYLLTKQIDID